MYWIIGFSNQTRRVSSMIYGRPTGIHFSHAAKHQHNFPQAVDDQYITLGQNQPDNKPSIYAFFHHVVRMYYVVDDVLGLLYGVNRGEGSDPGCGNNEPRCQIDDCRRFKAPSTLSAIIDIDHSLLSWHDSVPGYLRFSIDTSHSDDGQDMIIQRQKNILRYRFLSIRTLLHRQTLLYLLQSPERREGFQDSPHLPTPSTAAHSLLSERGLRSPFESSFTHISARLCVCSAELLIEAVSAGRPLNLAGAWWWDFYCELTLPDPHVRPLILYSSLQLALRHLWGYGSPRNGSCGYHPGYFSDNKTCRTWT